MMLTPGILRAQNVNDVDSILDQDPDLTVPQREVRFSPKLLPLWLSVLERDNADLKRKVIESIVRAYRLGMPGLKETIPVIEETLSDTSQHPLVRLSAARALVVLDARVSAPLLSKYISTAGGNARQFVEPALARWDYEPARDVWLARLADPGFLRRPLLLAINGIATVGDTRATATLLELATNREQPADIRLEAARTVSILQTSGLEEPAAALAADQSSRGLIDRLVSAYFLTRHSSEETRSLLLKLALDQEPAVAAVALQRLLELDPNLIVSMSDQIISSADANVRRLGAEALVARPSVDTIRKIGTMLDDPHPALRRYVRMSLADLSTSENFDTVVREQTMNMLRTSSWRGLEQAAILAANLDHEPAADRLIELLEFERPEVFVAAAWSLRKLAIPDTLDPLLGYATRMTNTKLASNRRNVRTAEQVSQIFQMFGQMKFAESETLLRRYIPKNSFHFEPRSAAIWSLGHLYAGSAPSDLTELFADRMTDKDPDEPEQPKVRRMSSVSLGRMKSSDALPALQFTADDELPGLIGYTSLWSIDQITGEGLQEPEVPPLYQRDWFLEPLE